MSQVGKDRGFSLLELLLVLLLIGLASMIVMPALDRALDARAVSQHALEIAAVARNLRSRALFENTPQRLIFYLSENSYEPFGGKRVTLSPDVRISAIDGGEVVGDGQRQFLFFPNGTMLGGAIAISGGERSSTYLIRLDGLSGRVLVEKGNRR